MNEMENTEMAVPEPAEPAPTVVTPTVVTPTAETPTAVTPTAVTPTAETPTAMTATAVTPTAMTPTAVTPTAVNPTAVATPLTAPGGVTADGTAAVTEKRKHRISTSTLMTTGLLVGVLGGAGVGYAIQSSRPATPLPPLAQTQPKYAPVGVYQGVAPAPLPSSQDDATLTEGDLTTLLLTKPAGASDADSIYTGQMIGADEDAYYCDDQVACYTRDYTDHVEAIADTEWTTSDGFYVEIRMYRFAPGDSATARTRVSNVGTASAAGNSLQMPTGIDAQGYEFVDSSGNNTDFAEAAHGDIQVSFWVSSSSKVPDPTLIDGLISEQMRRL
jgi:hypothetical protein